jgi:hypothetical protein
MGRKSSGRTRSPHRRPGSPTHDRPEPSPRRHRSPVRDMRDRGESHALLPGTSKTGSPELHYGDEHHRPAHRSPLSPIRSMRERGIPPLSSGAAAVARLSSALVLPDVISLQGHLGAQKLPDSPRRAPLRAKPEKVAAFLFVCLFVCLLSFVTSPRWWRRFCLFVCLLRFVTSPRWWRRFSHVRI